VAAQIATGKSRPDLVVAARCGEWPVRPEAGVRGYPQKGKSSENVCFGPTLATFVEGRSRCRKHAVDNLMLPDRVGEIGSVGRAVRTILSIGPI
jgi:hypothetical protein